VVAPKKSQAARSSRAALATGPCPLPLAHDRLEEAHYFLHQMLETYHHPHTFRFNTNAFLHALKSVLDMLRIDLEKLGQNEWRKSNTEPLKADPLFAAFSRGRDVVMHAGSLVQSSRVEVGLFRGDKLKSAFEFELSNDAPSHVLVAQVKKGKKPLFRADHSNGLVLGVRRRYFEPRLSKDQDVITASSAALAKVARLVVAAHNLLGFTFDGDFDGPANHDVAAVELYVDYG
jgi:hypothetical protein